MAGNPVTKRKLLTVKIDTDVLREFQIAAALRGLTMSSLVHQFVLKTIREEKEKAPRAFGIGIGSGGMSVTATRHEIFAEAFDGHALDDKDWSEIEEVVQTLVEQKKSALERTEE